MIYLDTSTVLAHLLSEDRRPPAALWDNVLVSSRLIEYETWTRLHRAGLGEAHIEAARLVMSRLALVELSPVVLARVLEPFPGTASVRTLDALHLATCDYLHRRGRSIELASYDHRMNDAADAMGIPLFDLSDALTHPGPALVEVLTDPLLV